MPQEISEDSVLFQDKKKVTQKELEKKKNKKRKSEMSPIL